MMQFTLWILNKSFTAVMVLLRLIVRLKKNCHFFIGYDAASQKRELKNIFQRHHMTLSV